MDELNRLKAAGQKIKTDPDCMKRLGEISQIEPDNEEMETVTLGMPNPVDYIELDGVPTLPDDDDEVVMGNLVVGPEDIG